MKEKTYTQTELDAILKYKGYTEVKPNIITTTSQLDELFLNKIVLVRTYSAGVFYGTLIAKNGKQGLLHKARRLWKWAGAFSLSELATIGTTDPENCKFSTASHEVLLEEVIEINMISDTALRTLNEVKDYVTR